MAKKKSRNRKISEYEFTTLSDIAFNNCAARHYGPERKHWTTHDLISLRPLTENQRLAYEAYFQGDNLVMHGSAGTGKTFNAVYLAMTDVLNKEHPAERVIIIRSAVPSREQGHLPGTLDEKNAEYEHVYSDILHELCGKASTYENMKKRGIVQFKTTGFLRGLTWNDSVVIVEEAQNMTFHEIDTIMTRVGSNTRLIMTGDSIQCDLTSPKHGVSGFDHAIRVCEMLDDVTCIKFTPTDNVRSGFSKRWLLATEQLATQKS